MPQRKFDRIRKFSADANDFIVNLSKAVKRMNNAGKTFVWTVLVVVFLLFVRYTLKPQNPRDFLKFAVPTNHVEKDLKHQHEDVNHQTFFSDVKESETRFGVVKDSLPAKHVGRMSSFLSKKNSIQNIHSKFVVVTNHVKKDQKHQHEDLKHQHEDLTHQHEDLKHQHEDLTHQHEDLKHQHEDLTHQHEYLKHQHGNLKHQYVALKHEHEDLKHQHENLKYQHENLKHQYEDLKHQHEDLKHKNFVSATKENETLVGVVRNSLPGKHIDRKTSFFVNKGSIQNNRPSISLFLRMSGKRQDHKERFYCNMLKTIPLFWPGWLGKMVLVLDKESKKDHAFGETLLNQTKEYFPHQAFKIDYERLPKDPTVLTFRDQIKSSGYNRQLWSSFFIDLYTDDEVIAWLDSDSPFVLPVTMSTITPHGKVRVLGTECTMQIDWVQSWAESTEMAIGFPQVADFMTYFPVYIYRDTFTHCREHILKKFKTDNFEEAFKKFYHTGTGYISPVSVIFSYAWFFEKDRYDWNIKMCNNLDEYNERFPEGHKILQNDIINENKLLTQPQTAYHGPLNAQDYYAKLIPISYCLSISEAGRSEDMCKKYSRSDLSRLFNLFKSDMHSIKERSIIPHPCIGSRTQYCLSILERHIKNVGVEIKENKRRMTWDDVTTVDSIADKLSVKCPPQPL